MISSTTYYIRISPSTTSQHIIPLVINSLEDETHVQTHTRHAYRHAPNVWTESSFGWQAWFKNFLKKCATTFVFYHTLLWNDQLC